MSVIEDIYSRNLPKWPHAVISGKKISIDRTKDIIFKTDNFFYSDMPKRSNRKSQHQKSYRKNSGLHLFDTYLDIVYEALATRNEDGAQYHLSDDIGFHKLAALSERLYIELGVEKLMNIEYIHNDLADSKYIGGANGYIDCDGNISFSRNIGKWPYVDEIHSDLNTIANAFPYLEFVMNVYDGEKCERNERALETVVSFVAKDGNVIICDMDMDVDLANDKNDDIDNLRYGSKSCGIPIDWFGEFAEIVLNAMKSSGVYDELTSILKKVQMR